MQSLRWHFPIFTNNPDLIFLDSASSAQKPQAVIDAVSEYMSTDYANVHRGMYELSQRSEDMIDATRELVAQWINAQPDEVVFTKNSTDASNLLIHSLVHSEQILDWSVIYLCEEDHHASIVPWQIIQERFNQDWKTLIIQRFSFQDKATWTFQDATVVMAPIISNVVGVINPIQKLKQALSDSTLLCLDASQALPHIYCDVQTLQCDYLWFTGHKLGAYPWVWVLRGKREHLQNLQPAMGWWGAVSSVSHRWFTLQDAPDKFEPWTPNLSAICSLQAALIRSEQVWWSVKWWYTKLRELDKLLIEQTVDRINTLPVPVELVWGTDHPRVGLFTLQFEQGARMQSLGRHLADKWVAVRVGGLCAHPYHAKFNDRPSLRISTRIYTSVEEIDYAFDCIEEFFQ